MRILVELSEIVPLAKEVTTLLRCSHSDSPDDKELVVEILDRLMDQYFDVYHRDRKVTEIEDQWLWDEVGIDLLADLHLAISLDLKVLLAAIGRRCGRRARAAGVNVMNTKGDVVLHVHI